MRNRVGAIVMASAALLFMATTARADDWPTQGLNAARSRASTELSGTSFRAQTWTYAVPGALWSTSSPAVADGIVVFGTRDGTVHALRASSGRLLWLFKAQDGVMASPAIHRGRVFVSSLDSKLYALRLSDGALVWSRDLKGLAQSSPTIIEDSIIVSGGYPVRTLIRIDTLTGATIWETAPDGMAQFSNAAVASDGQQVIAGAQEGHLYSFDLATGTRRWTYQADGIVNLSAPLIVGDRVYLLPGGSSGRLHAVSLVTGQAIAGWPVDLPLVAIDAPANGKMLNRTYAVSSLAWVADRLVFDARIDDSMDTNKDGIPDQFVMREFVMALSGADGQMLWQQTNGNGTLDSTNDMPKHWLCPTPAAYQNAGARSYVVAVASTLTPTLRTLDAANGTSRGSIPLSAPSRVSPVLANGRLFVGTEGGTLYASLSGTNRPPTAPVLMGTVGRPVPTTAAVVQWGASFDPEADAVSYQLRLDQDGEVLENWESEITTAAGETSVTLPRPLQAGATYTFLVRARDSKGAWSDWSAPQVAKAMDPPSVTVGGLATINLAGALRASVAGSVIRLGAGTFYLTETMRVPPGASLEGAGPQQTILDATGQAAGVSLDGSVDGKPSEVKGLTVTGAKVGIAVGSAHDVRIKNVIARDNHDAGIEIGAAGSATIINATLAANGRGVRSFGSAIVKNSIVTGSQAGLVSDHPDALVSRFNDVTGNVVAFQGLVAGANDLARDVVFLDYAKRDLHVMRGQPSTDHGDPADDFAAEPAPNGARINLGAFGGTAEAELTGAPPSADPAPVGKVPTPTSGGGCAVGGGGDKGSGVGAWIIEALIAAGLLYLGLRRRRKLKIALVAGILLGGCLVGTTASAAVCTWKPTSGINNWDATPASTYWTCGNTPTSADDVVFSTAGTCTLNVAIDVLSLSMNSGAGSVTGGGSDIVVRGDFNLASGTFTASSGLTRIRGDFNKTGGTFTHNSGTLMLNATSGANNFVSASATFKHVAITDGLVGYWKLDETSGTTAVDSSGYGNNGTHTGSPTISATVPSLDFADARSVQFNGATPTYIQTGTIPTELMPSVVTVAAWYKATTVDSGGADVVSGSNRYVLRVNTSGATSLIKQTASGTWAFATATVASNLDGNWHHIAGTITGTTMTLYFDGASVATTADSTAIYYTSPSGLAIGRNPGSATQDFTGNIDDVRVYNRALSAADIAALYAGGQPSSSVATYTLTGNPTITGDLILGSGTLAGGNTTINVAGNWWNYGGTFTTGTSGTVNFNGSSSGKTILASGSDFNNLTISGSGAWTVSDVSLLTVDKNLSQSAGTLNTAATLLAVDGSFNQTAGTFSQTSGLTLLDASSSQTLGTAGTTTFNNLTINDGLKGYWKLDENTGTTLADQSGRSNDGTLTSGSWVSGANLPSLNFNDVSALSFNGTSTYATLGTTGMPTLNGSKTIAGWLYWASKPGAASNAIVFKAGGTYLQMGFYTTTGLIKVWTNSGSLIVGSASTPTSGWHHVAYTWDGTTNSLYIDGGTPATSTTAPPSGSVTAGYLGSYDGAHEFWTGRIDEVRIYNRVLTASEINSLAIGAQPGSASATHTLSGSPTISGDLVIASGKLDAGGNNISVGGNWWNYGGLFNATTSSTITFNGSGAGKVIRSAGGMFGAVTVNGTGSWTLADRMDIDPAAALTMTAGTLSLSSYTFRGGNVDKNGVALTTSTGKVVLDGSTSFTIDQGSFTDLRVEPVAATALVGYWKMDEGQGPIVHDFSSSGNDATLTNGPVWTDTGLPSGIKFDNPGAVTFDGTTVQEYAATSSFPSNLQPSVVTLSAWYKATTIDSAGADIVSGSNRYVLRITSSGAVSLIKQTASGTWAFATGTTPSSLDGNWHHVAGTMSGTTMTTYFDGVQVATTADANAIYYTSPSYLAIGRNPISATQDFNGTIDDVRVYNVALTAAQIAALARGTNPAGLSGNATYTLGANTTVSGTLALENGTLATSTYTMNASGSGSAATVYSGTYQVGSATNTFAGGLTVNADGTLYMPTSGGTVAVGSTKTLTMDGTLNATSTSAVIQTAGGAGTYYTFSVGSTATATPTLNITGLQVKNPDTAGMNINVNHSATTTFTRFDNIAFSGGPTTAGARLLQIYAPTLYLVSNGCSFTHTATTYNVTLTGDTSSATETRAYFGNATCSPTTCEAYDNDDDSGADGLGDNMTTNGSVVQWIHSGMADTSGTIEGFPTAAFDWNLFTYYSTYVAYHDVDGGTTDRIYVRSTNGAALYSWDTPSGVDLIGTPRYDTVSSVHYVYVATTSGKIYRLIDNGSSSLTQDNSGNWAGANNPYDCGCTITTPLTVDSNNIYWAGTATGNKVWTLGKTSRTLASSSPYSALTAVSGAAPTVWTSANSHVQMFMGASAHFYKVDINTQTLTTDNSSPTGSVNGRLSVINSKVYGADNRGSLWVLDPETFSSTVWSYHDNTNHNGCSAGTACAVTGSLYVDILLNRAFYGDSDGHLYASYNSSGTGVQATGWPYSTGNTSDVFAAAPFYNSGIVVAGSTIGNLYIIDVNGGSGPVLKQTYKFGTATTVSGVGYDRGSASYMVSTSNATNKDGKLIYIDAMTDPTSGSN